VKKILIVAVCLALVLTLAFTLGALGKKPDKPEKPPGKPEHFIYELTFKGDVTGTEDSPVVEQCSAQGGFISSSNDEDFRPNLCLVGKKFDDYEICTEKPHGRYLDLTEHKGEITMQFFFIDQNDEKVQLTVYGNGDELVDNGEWLSSSFLIEFVGDPAEITPTKGKRDPLWGPEPVYITIECHGYKEE